MPHNASEYVTTNVLPHIGVVSPTAYTINYLDALSIQQILYEDAREYLYSGILSVANAYASIRLRYYSWATVKLYYATFYMLRGLLANAGICICYTGNKPMIVKAVAGEQLRKPPGVKRAGTTHGIVLETAKRELPNDLIFSQPIAGMHPVEWMRERREEANYWHSRLVEPGVPDQMRMVEQNGIRKLVTACVSDLLGLAFDPDHAIMAYPMLVWNRLKEQILAQSGTTLDEDDKTYLRSLFVDNAGILTAMRVLIENGYK
jgi:hypothetical protein